MRELEGHKVNGVNNGLLVEVIDDRSHGNASHKYLIRASVPNNVKQLEPTQLHFQNGPIAEVGVNGITHETLLAVLIDRLEGFQSGPYKCQENQAALEALQQAQSALQSRTKDRAARGVEGTHKV